MYQELLENERIIQENDKYLRRTAANPNAYKDTNTYEEMIKQIKATEVEDADKKIKAILELMNMRK